MQSCVIIVENLPVPADRRVWQEALTLKKNGWDVSIICPRTERHPEEFLQLEGIDIYRHSMPSEGNGFTGYLIEYVAALLHECHLLAKIFKKKRLDLIHICNPPDILFINTLPYKLLGLKVIFDYHDICPELFVSKFGKCGLLHSLLVFFERITFKVSDVVIAANDSFRNLAITRGGKLQDDVFTVYSVPDLSCFRAIAPQVRDPDRVVIGYAGVMGKQDGVCNLINAVISLKQRNPKTDILCRIVGDGTELTELKRLVSECRAEDLFDFTGFLTGDTFLRQLGSFDIGVIPDSPNIYNDRISMNKVFEYMAIGIPIVSFRLPETMRLLGDAGNYATDPTPASLADALLELVESPELRASRGRSAANRFANNFSWENEARNLVAAYDRAVSREVKKSHSFRRVPDDAHSPADNG